jgi:hypothetical protein
MSKPTKADPSQIDWSLKAYKRFNDGLILEIVGEAMCSRSKVNVLSFPEKQWLWEKSMLAQFSKGWHFTGVECDKKVFPKMQAEAELLQVLYPKCTFEAIHKDVSKLLDTDHTQRDVIYLDFMGTWAEPKRQILTQICEENILAKNGFLIMTLGLTRGHTSTEELQEYIRGDHDFLVLDSLPKSHNVHGGTHYKTRGIVGWVSMLAENYGQKWTPQLCRIYYNLSEKSSPKPEVLIILQRTK